MFVLEQSGNIVTRTYESGQDTLSGNVLQVTWPNSASHKMETFRFIFEDDYSKSKIDYSSEVRKQTLKVWKIQLEFSIQSMANVQESVT